VTGADYSPLDEALEQLAFAGPELKNTNSNHAPMAIEALCTLGRGRAVQPWLERYRDGLLPRPPRSQRIGRTEWATALGQPRRVGDWFELFGNELSEEPWRAVLERWVPRLAPGIVDARRGKAPRRELLRPRYGIPLSCLRQLTLRAHSISASFAARSSASSASMNSSSASPLITLSIL